jgi:hypothetical protein
VLIPSNSRGRCRFPTGSRRRAGYARLKRLQAETAAELNALLPSVLDKAFKGELWPGEDFSGNHFGGDQAEPQWAPRTGGGLKGGRRSCSIEPE